MRKFWLVLVIGFLAGCDSVDVENRQVDRQQDIYNKNQPPPFFEWSLQRQLWHDFYKEQNSAVSTWSYITDQYGNVRFETPSQGFPIPIDTQLTNPLQVQGANGAVVEQPEPNGLFTSKNTDATIVMAANDDGTLSPIYTELKVTTFPFPVKWEDGKWMRIKDKEPTIKLSIKKAPSAPAP